MVSLAGLFISGMLWASAGPIDVVFDLDHTLITETPSENVVRDGRRVFQFGDHFYRLTDHTVEVLRAVHGNPAYRISFYSGGERERNMAVLSWIYELVNADGRGSRRPFQVLSREDLHRRPGVGDDARFTQRYGKDLTRIHPSVDLRRAVLIDDAGAFAEPGQERNMLWLEKTYNDRPVYPHGMPEGPYEASSRAQWLREKHKLAWAYDLLEEAREASERTGRDFRDELAERATREAELSRELARNVSPRADLRIEAGFQRLGFVARPSDRRGVDALLCRAVF